MKGKEVAFLGIMTSLSLCLSFLESLLPSFIAVPGVKIGLANIVIVFILYRGNFKQALIVSLVRVFLSALLFSNILTLAYSSAGALLSLIAMAFLKKAGCFSPAAVSIAGGVVHNLAQIALACLILKAGIIAYYIPVLVVSGTICGALTGIIASLLMKRLEKANV